ncbi:MAG: peptide chain release factor N(5)-glutamine methyltransferase [Acidobacteriota bacterium]|nr:peptide chain release factor N(5)-glutamine methyltransferase [Acidobacteriota bacterium]
MSVTVDDLIRDARRRLSEAPHGPSTREALLLMARLLERDEAYILAHGEHQLEASEIQRFQELLQRRLTGEPMAYVLGAREFYGRQFRVDSRVLIPRPETEHLVEAALEWDLPPEPQILDVGTGSGCLAVTLALEIPGARVTAVDISLGALAVAQANAGSLGAAESVHALCIDLVCGLELETFDLVVSNPPYIAPEEAPELSPEILDYEPTTALFADSGGLAVLHRLLAAAAEFRPGCPLMVEIGADQRAALTAAATDRGLEVRRVIHDYAGIARTLVLTRPPSKS